MTNCRLLATNTMSLCPKHHTAGALSALALILAIIGLVLPTVFYGEAAARRTSTVDQAKFEVFLGIQKLGYKYGDQDATWTNMWTFDCGNDDCKKLQTSLEVVIWLYPGCRGAVQHLI